MPPAGAPRSTGDHAAAQPPSHASLNDSDRTELEKLDAAVGRMQEQTRPDPYLVTISQDRHLQYQYQWRSQQWQWLHNTPFRPEEGEGIQYQTFIYQEPGKNMLSLHAQHYPEERPATADSTRNATGANTPAQAPKKVISFGAYKKKQTGETPTRENANSQEATKSAKQAALKGPVEQDKTLKADSADMIKALEEDEKVDSIRDTQSKKKEPRKEELQPKQSELKRKREDNATTTEKAPDMNGRLSPPPTKKAKSVRSPSPPARRASQKDAHAENRMPPKLSPLRQEPSSPDRFELPPRISPDLPDTFQLPPRISPILPANIRASLEAMDERGVVGRAPRKESVAKKDNAPNSESYSKSTARKRSPDRRKSPRARSKSPDKSSGKPSAQDAPEDEPARTVDGGEKKQSLIAKIKFKKARKEDVQRILKLPARPDKYETSPPATPDLSDRDDPVEPPSNERSASKQADRADSARRAGKGVAQKLGPAAKRTEQRKATSEKRPGAEPDSEPANTSGPPAKRAKNDSVQESSIKQRQAESASSETTGKQKDSDTIEVKRKINSAAQADTPSPAAQGKLKSVAARKDLNAKRDGSADGQASTSHSQSQSASNKTSHTSQPNGTVSKKSSNSTLTARKATSQDWTAERERLEKIGREIKHAASDLLSDKPNAAAREAAAVKSIESLICYLLAFTCADRAAALSNKKSALQQWRSLQPFSGFVERNAAPFPALSGLASALSLSHSAHFLNLVLQSPNEGPSRDSLITINGALIKAAANADEKLDVDTLMENFPRTWKGRSKSSVIDDDSDEPKRLLEGCYRLPLGVQTEPVQAARAGVAVLREWVAKVGLEYEFHLVA